MPTTTPTWIWYDAGDIYTRATSDTAGFEASVRSGGPVLSSYTEDAFINDQNDDERIDDIDSLGTGDTFTPGAAEGITIGGSFRQVETFSRFFVDAVTTDGATVSDLPMITYQFSDGSIAFRLADPGVATLLSNGVQRNEIADFQFGDEPALFFRSIAVDGHNDAFPCYAAGTMIDTPNGQTPVEKLKVGDLIWTLKNSQQPIRWIGQRRITFPRDGSRDHLRPVRIDLNLLTGAACEGRLTITVSPQHRILLRSPIVQRMFDTPEILVPAKALLGRPGCRVVEDIPAITYVHFICDDHQIVAADGVLSESLYLGDQACSMLGREAMSEIMEIFPELRDHGIRKAAPFAGVRKGRRLVERHLRNQRPLGALRSAH
ncbi:Hint domain-containing protein [Paracoccus sp. R12_1]|uniref:Hint domain-containing protein n=1 Tax=unclassified Paracoccus (in: a-proteobacteria) TaxID=2688777 RepID=UPI001AD96CE9|nr:MULTISPECIES: Hint domain-containing protein [unclassified Paracoccus (in: a-proteobacteria)]MBO9453621.1 Hint domain-containing protein [Paracoccus sp. R12_2]MBO9486955.1 Hint domain-containing protein [Paracoccus sp. R12_1]